MKTLSLALVVAALALAAPALADPGSTALYPETIPGPGLPHTVAGSGRVGAVPFAVTPTRISFGSFRSLAVREVVFGTNAVRLRGTGLVGGRRVAFTAVGVHDARPGVDVLRIAWSHGASLGGVVTRGLLVVR